MTTGSGSSFPITRLAAKYNKQISDGVVLSNRAAIDIIDIRVKQLLERVDVGEAPDRVAKLYDLWKEFKKWDPAMPEYLTTKFEMDVAFEQIYHDYMAWNQIFNALELRGKATEREIKALTQIKAVMTAEDGYNMIAKVMAVTMRIIGDDPKKLKELQYEYARLIGESSDLVAQGIIEDDGGSGEAE